MTKIQAWIAQSKQIWKSEHLDEMLEGERSSFAPYEDASKCVCLCHVHVRVAVWNEWMKQNKFTEDVIEFTEYELEL